MLGGVFFPDHPLSCWLVMLDRVLHSPAPAHHDRLVIWVIAAGWLIKGVKARWLEDTTGSSETRCIWWCSSVRLIQSQVTEKMLLRKPADRHVPSSRPRSSHGTLFVQYVHKSVFLFYFFYSAGLPDVAASCRLLWNSQTRLLTTVQLHKTQLCHQPVTSLVDCTLLWPLLLCHMCYGSFFADPRPPIPLESGDGSLWSISFGEARLQRR